MDHVLVLMDMVMMVDAAKNCISFIEKNLFVNDNLMRTYKNGITKKMKTADLAKYLSKKFKFSKKEIYKKILMLDKK